MPDTLVGTDSHTTMINGLGVLGWGVGGIEAEAVTLGQPYYMLVPEVIGYKLTGCFAGGRHRHRPGVLTVPQIVRAHGVVGKFVEFYGEGLSKLSLPDRATIANMSSGVWGDVYVSSRWTRRRSSTCGARGGMKSWSSW